MATWTTIPDDFGTGGSGINPTGTEPSIKTLLQEIQDNVDLNTDITDNTTAIAHINSQIGTGNCEELSANGAVSVIKRTSRFTVSGTKAWTLADGVIAGQRKTLFCVSQAATPVGVITPAHGSSFTTVTFGVSSANASVELEWDASLGTPAWKVVGVSGTSTIA